MSTPGGQRVPCAQDQDSQYASRAIRIPSKRCFIRVPGAIPRFNESASVSESCRPQIRACSRRGDSGSGRYRRKATGTIEVSVMMAKPERAGGRPPSGRPTGRHRNHRTSGHDRNEPQRNTINPLIAVVQIFCWQTDCNRPSQVPGGHERREVHPLITAHGHCHEHVVVPPPVRARN